MYCTQCGTQLPDDSRFCYKCGTPTHLAQQKDSISKSDYDPFDPSPYVPDYKSEQQQQSQQQPPRQNTVQYTTDEGAFGLVGFIMAFFIPILGLILSIIGTTKSKNQGLATAGVIISIIFIAIAFAIGIAAATGAFYIY